MKKIYVVQEHFNFEGNSRAEVFKDATSFFDRDLTNFEITEEDFDRLGEASDGDLFTFPVVFFDDTQLVVQVHEI